MAKEAAPKTHRAVVTTAVRAPLAIAEVETVPPGTREVLVRVEYVASTPLDLHQNDGGLLVKHPQVLGDGLSGTVVQTGERVSSLVAGDQVFGFGWREQKEKAYQEFATLPEYLLGKVPAGTTLQEAVTLPNNFVTVFHALTADLSIQLPWPRSTDAEPRHAHDPILIWGGSSSVGIFALQIFRFYGFTNLIAIASQPQHQYLKSLGASSTFDYREPNVVNRILDSVTTQSGHRPAIPFILDCIGSKSNSIASVAQIAQKGSKVAVLLPVILRDSSDTVAPQYSMDPSSEARWAEGVEVKGVRTHFYLENDFLKEHLQPTIMPTLLSHGIVQPNRQRIIEGATLLERAQKALDVLRRKEISGERLVWRIQDGGI